MKCIIPLFSLVIAVFLSGCSITLGDIVDTDEIYLEDLFSDGYDDQMALDYLEEKYGEEFGYAGPWGDSMDGDREILAGCDSLSDLVLVEIADYREDSRVFSDNYMALKYKDDITQFIQEQADAVFDQNRVYYESARSVLSPAIGSSASMEDVLRDSEMTLFCRVEVPASELTMDAAKAFASKASQYGNINITLYGTEDADFETLDWESIMDMGIMDQLPSMYELFVNNDRVEDRAVIYEHLRGAGHPVRYYGSSFDNLVADAV